MWSIGKLKFDYANKWYIYNPESIRENETHKFLWDFHIQTVHLILARRQDLLIIKKEILTNCGICFPGWPYSKIKRKWKEE